ncbi:MAG: hypothetical protein JXQ96_12850 [Cyclobacteriaceae bacterium]
MKSLVYRMIVFCLLGLMSLSALAKNLDSEKKRMIEKSYRVGADHKLDIQNKFGRVHINTSATDRIDVSIEIIARGSNDERAQRILDKIDVDIQDSGKLLKFETKLNGINSKNSETFEINYTVQMPKRNPLKLNNSFGDTYVGDLTGETDIDVSYGDLKAGSITGRSKLKISFGDGEIDRFMSGDVEVKYSDVEFDELGDVRIEDGFSDVSIDKAGNLDITCKYGEFDLGELKSATGYVGYSDFKVDRLHNSIEMETAYSGGFKIDEISKSFKNIDLKGKFGSFKLGFEEGVNATFESRVKYCNLDYDDLDVELTYKMKGDFNSEYRGKIGNGNGGRIKVESSYGDVKFLER